MFLLAWVTKAAAIRLARLSQQVGGDEVKLRLLYYDTARSRKKHASNEHSTIAPQCNYILPISDLYKSLILEDVMHVRNDGELRKQKVCDASRPLLGKR